MATLDSVIPLKSDQQKSSLNNNTLLSFLFHWLGTYPARESYELKHRFSNKFLAHNSAAISFS